MGDGRTYDQVCALRAVTSIDGMTADWFPFDAGFLANVSTRIINEIRDVNRVDLRHHLETARDDRVGVGVLTG